MNDSACIPIFHETGYYRRICTIIPLYLNDAKNVIPIPCLIDTGAPAFMLLGSAASNILKKQGVLKGEINYKQMRGIVRMDMN